MVDVLKMLLDEALSFPTVIFTVMLGLVLVYWLISAVSGVSGSVDGAAEGMIEGMTGGLLDGVADGAVEGLADGLLEGAADGVLDGAVDGLADGVLDGATDGAAEVIGHVGTAGKVIGCLGITAVPATIFMSIMVGFSWVSSIALSKLMGRHVGMGTTGLMIGAGIFIGAVVLGTLFTSWAVRPLKPLFRSDKTVTRREFVGRVCMVSTLEVNDNFGMAEYDDGQAGLLLQVRCDSPNTLGRGDRAVVERYDPEDDVLYLAAEPVQEEISSDDALKPGDYPHREDS